MKRRAFVIGSASVAGGVLIGGYRLLDSLTPANPLEAILEEGQIALTPYVIVDRTGVSIVAPRAEMGQGIHGTLAALVAEELDIPLADVRVIHGPASAVYANHIAYPPPDSPPNWKGRLRARLEGPQTTQLTGGQSSTQDAFVKMRKAGAAARAVLLEAAAQRMGAQLGSLRTEQGTVVHTDGRRMPYTELAAEAALIEPPSDPVLKPREEWTQLGTSQPRVDMVGKCTGTATYAIDVRLPDMLFAVVKLNPHIGGGLRGYDAAAAEIMPGVQRVVELPDGIAVVATNTWYALRAAEVVDIAWGPAPYPEDTDAHRAVLDDAVAGEGGDRWRDDGEADPALAEGDVLEATYHAPYLAHATMEPMNAVAWMHDGELDIWAGTQNPTLTRVIGAEVSGVAHRRVRVHTTYMGGGFGRRLEMDFVRTAVLAARAVSGTPVLVTWPREQDMTQDTYRPMASARFRGALQSGRPTALDLRVSSPALFSSSSRRLERRGEDVPEVPDNFSVTGVADQPYRIPNYRVTACPAARLLPVGWWRGVGESQNTFFHESAIDELAHAAGADPLEFRLSLLDHPPSRAVLEAVADLSGWGSALPDGEGRGVAYALSSGAATAQVVHVRQGEGGLRVAAAYFAVDVGIALDPRNIDAQVMSAVVWGLCSAIRGEITVTDGRVVETNYDTYPIMRIHEAPPVKLHIHESGREIYGVGEAGTPTAAPALGNAIFAATGRRIRRLPFETSLPFETDPTLVPS